jgi:hypothetical protein
VPSFFLWHLLVCFDLGKQVSGICVIMPFRSIFFGQSVTKRVIMGCMSCQRTAEAYDKAAICVGPAWLAALSHATFWHVYE